MTNRNILLAHCALLLLSCSPIGKDEYLIEMPAAEVGRKILIEDFTGQKCVNCPEAAAKIEELMAQYGEDNIVAVGIHCGNNALTNPLYTLMNNTGKDYGEYWKVDDYGQPCGMVNRGGMSYPSDWSTQVYEAIQRKTPLTLDISTMYTQNTRMVEIGVVMKSMNDISGKLQVWLLENGISARQQTPNSGNGYDMNYIHNHVFREAVNTPWGEDVSIQANETVTKTYKITLDEKYNADNCTIVAFVANDGDVLQAAKKQCL